jgi:hypothetical protein
VSYKFLHSISTFYRLSLSLTCVCIYIVYPSFKSRKTKPNKVHELLTFFFAKKQTDRDTVSLVILNGIDLVIVDPVAMTTLSFFIFVFFYSFIKTKNIFRRHM